MSTLLSGDCCGIGLAQFNRSLDRSNVIVACGTSDGRLGRIGAVPCGGRSAHEHDRATDVVWRVDRCGRPASGGASLGFPSSSGGQQHTTPALAEEADLLVASAWLHDIGYAESVQDTGFHPLDGARHLRKLGVEERLCRLVANHSGGQLEAELRGLADELAEFPDEASLLRDGLWYCDMTTSPVGQPVRFDERLAEIRERYGPEHTVPRAISAAANEIRAAIAAVHDAAARCGIAVDG